MAGLDPAIQSFSAPPPGWPARGPAMRDRRTSGQPLNPGQRLEQPQHENDDQDEADDAAEPAAAIAAITPAATAKQQHENDDDEKRGGRHGWFPFVRQLSNDDLRSSK